MNRTPIRRGVLDLTNPGPRMWSGSEIKEAQMTIHDIVESQVDCIKRVVPWFLGNMPVTLCAKYQLYDLCLLRYLLHCGYL